MMLTRRTFLSRTASAIFGVMAAVYALWSGDVREQEMDRIARNVAAKFRDTGWSSMRFALLKQEM